MTPFGCPVEPEVKRNFAIVSGPVLAWAASTAAVGLAAMSSAKAMLRRSAAGVVATTISTPGGTAAAIAGAKAVPFAAKTRPGVRISTMALSLPKSFDISEYGTEIGA